MYRQRVKRFSETPRPVWLRYGFALVASALAVVFAHLYWEVFKSNPFMLAFLAVFVSGWFGGAGPSLLAVIAGALGTDYFFLEPLHLLRVADPQDIARLVLFLLVGCVISLMFRQIGRNRLAREQLAGDAMRLAAIVESSEDAIIGMDLNGIVTSWNAGAERIFGYSEREILGNPVSTLMPKNRRDEMTEILSRIRQGERVEHFETIRVKKNGETLPVSLSASPIKDSSGAIVGEAKIARDITEQKRSEAERERLYQEARDAARVREEFLSMAGHELRTPLTSLQFQLHSLRRKIEAGESKKGFEILGRAVAQVERLARLTDELLDVSRITAGQLTLEPEETDLGRLVAEVVDRMKDGALRAGSELRIDAPTGTRGHWDRSRLDQVTTNLLSNAIKFGEGKPIDIKVEPDTDRVCLIVRDYGIGISPEDQAKIFERFERAVSRQSYGGIGLGLWISRQIVDAHGGQIEVSSEPGKGSTFRVELPKGASS